MYFKKNGCMVINDLDSFQPMVNRVYVHKLSLRLAYQVSMLFRNTYLLNENSSLFNFKKQGSIHFVKDKALLFRKHALKFR